jgi:hypothetical protein
MRKLTIILVLAVIAPVLHAQKPSNAQARKMNLLAIELLDRYELYSTLSDRTTTYRFTKMFENADTEVLCDLHNSSKYYYKQIPLSQYKALVADSGCKSIDVRVSNVRKKGRPEFSDGRWYYTVTFDKEIMFQDHNGVLFPLGLEEDGSDKREIFSMEMTIVFDADLQEAHIHSLHLQPSVSPKTLEKVLVLQECDQKYRKFEQDVKHNGRQLVYNSFDHAFAAPSDRFTHYDEDVEVERITIISEDAYDLIKLKYVTTRTRLKLRNEIAPVMYSMQNAPSGYSSSSFGYALGFDLGATFQLGKGTKGGFFVGAALSLSSFSAKLKDIGDYTLTYSGVDGSMVERSYSIDKIRQKAQYKDLVFPVYFNIESKVSPKLDLVFDLGAKVYLNLARQVGDAVAVGRVNDVKFASSYDTDAVTKASTIDPSVFFSAGVDYVLVSRKLYFEAKVGYERGFSTHKLSCEKAMSSQSYPVVYHGLTGEDLLVGPLLDGDDYEMGIRKSALWLSLGLKLKF